MGRMLESRVHRTAPKGCHHSARGNALGSRNPCVCESPERLIPPFQGETEVALAEAAVRTRNLDHPRLRCHAPDSVGPLVNARERYRLPILGGSAVQKREIETRLPAVAAGPAENRRVRLGRLRGNRKVVLGVVLSPCPTSGPGYPPRVGFTRPRRTSTIVPTVSMNRAITTTPHCERVGTGPPVTVTVPRMEGTASTCGSQM